MIVADTNLVAYLLIEGDKTAAARAVWKKDSRWMLPTLWRSEFLNVLTTAVRSRVLLALGYLYVFRLPRILERRMAWEKSVNPEMAKQNRRQWTWATIGRAAGAAIGGAVLMAMAVALQ
ncbi:MAG: hypothetical protein ACXWLY_31220 [Thermoanaerobaculia bacterium]